MDQTPRRAASDSPYAAFEAPPTPSEQRKRGRQQHTPSDVTTPSPARRRGCNCKKSGCLKLYCECFAANVRCGDRCQCMGCKNRDHNRLEIAHAMEAIEKRANRTAKSPIAAARKLENLRASTPILPRVGMGEHTPMDGATRLLLSAEQLEDTATTRTYTEGCICTPGACDSLSPCHKNHGGCTHQCACQQVPPSHEKSRGCSCKKSNCLKLYCECLAAQRECDSRCNCECCKNRPEHHDERERAIAAILERNPVAFRPKVATGTTHLRGCNCRKSNCMKNYCECHQAGVPCTSRCACQSCRNTNAFVSAKKMLNFSGDVKLRKIAAKAPSSPEMVLSLMGKPPLQPTRRASMDDSSPPPYFLTPTASQRMPDLLEYMSRTAPPAQPSLSMFEAPRHPTLAKRKLSEMDRVAEDLPVFSTPDAVRRSSSARFNTHERHGSSALQLPSVDETIEAELDASQAELPLSKLCRSLLNAASSVDTVPTPRQTERSPAIQRTPVGASTPTQSSTTENQAASPVADDLMCEEAIETPTRTARQDGASVSSQEQPTVDLRREQRIAAMQERAVLQEFSVWLRNLTTSTSLSS